MCVCVCVRWRFLGPLWEFAYFPYRFGFVVRIPPQRERIRNVGKHVEKHWEIKLISEMKRVLVLAGNLCMS